MVQERPRHAVFSGKMRRECFDSESFSSVVATVKHVDAKFLGHGVCPVRPFARDKRVDALIGRLFQISPCPTSNHADTPTNLWPAGNDQRAAPRGTLQTRG